MTGFELNQAELHQLITDCFAPGSEERSLAVLVDIPSSEKDDTSHWRSRRKIAQTWFQLLSSEPRFFSEIAFFFYPAVNQNNGNLPKTFYRSPDGSTPASAKQISNKYASTTDHKMFAKAKLILSLNQFSATAPLKMLAPKYQFKAASMPGFSQEMIPALKLDYTLIDQRVHQIKNRLDRAIRVEYRFEAEEKTFVFSADTRFRTAHASSGLLRTPGTAGNLPSGEAYIVPYEGENPGVESQSSGLIPVQFEQEVVVYQVKNNRAVEIVSEGKFSEIERIKLRREPAYGNIAELGFGVLDIFNLKPVNSILLDEKLGVHIAFGRSEHFGGITSPASFQSPDRVVHIDRVYIPECQSKIRIAKISFFYEDGEQELIMQEQRYV